MPIGHTMAPPMKCTIARMRPRIALGAYSPAYAKASGCSAPRPMPAMKRQRISSVTLGASAPRIVKVPNSSRLNW